MMIIELSNVIEGQAGGQGGSQDNPAGKNLIIEGGNGLGAGTTGGKFK